MVQNPFGIFTYYFLTLHSSLKNAFGILGNN